MTLPWNFAILMSKFEDDLEQLPATCREIGTDRLEGSFRAVESLSDAAFERLVSAFEAGGVHCPTFHLPFGGSCDIADFYETRRREAVERSIRVIERSVRLGARVGVQHPTTCAHNAEVEGHQRFLDQIRRSLDALVPVAERHDYTIALENLLTREAGPRFGSLPEHFELMNQALDYPNVGYCLDTGHALQSLGPGREADMFKAMGKKLAAFHLADNAGDRDSHLAPGRGLVNWNTIFRCAADLGFTGTMCIETPPFAPGPPYSVESWRQLLEETTALAEKALAPNAADHPA